MCTRTDTLSFELPRSVEAPGLARILVKENLCAEHGKAAAAATQLLATELTTCAVLYGSPPIRLELECSEDRLSVSVSHSTSADDVAEVPIDEAGGLRSALLDKLARSWGVAQIDGGRRLWCVLPTGAPPGPFVPRQRTSSRPAPSRW